MQCRDIDSLQPLPPGFKQFSASASRVARITDAHHHSQLLVFLVETRFHHLGQAGLELLALAFQSAGITGMRYCIQSVSYSIYYVILNVSASP